MSNRRRRSRRNLYLAIAAIAVSIVLLVLALGLYPVAIVQGKPIWASSFRSYVASALSYQQAAHDTYSASSTSLLAASRKGERALGVAALDELVEQKIIQRGLDELAGDNVDRLVEDKLEQIMKEPDLPGASRALFQLDPGTFVRTILRPQAEREVLAGRVYLDGKTLEEWVSEARSTARVRMLSSSYEWNGTNVVSK